MAYGAPGRQRGTCEVTEKVDRLQAEGGRLKTLAHNTQRFV